MKSSIYLLFLFLLCVCLFTAIEGCHKKRKKRAGGARSNSLTRNFLPKCLRLSSARTTKWEGPVDYIILHSEWYQTAATLCSATVGLDTPACWLSQINNLISAQSDLLLPVKRCLIQYSNTMGFNYVLTSASLIPSSSMDNDADDSACPSVAREDFRNIFMEESTNDMDESDDETSSELDSVIEVVQQDFICPSCNCASLSETSDEYEVLGTTSCGRCWASRIATLTRRGSRLARRFKSAAIRTGGVRRRMRMRFNQRANQNAQSQNKRRNPPLRR